MGRIKAPGRLWQKPRLATSPSFASVLKRCADRIAIVAIDEAKPGFHVLGYPFHDIGILEFSLGYWGLGFRGFGFRVLGFGVSLGCLGFRGAGWPCQQWWCHVVGLSSAGRDARIV